MGKTLIQDIEGAHLVVFAELSNAKRTPNAKLGEPDGRTDMTIIRVIKDHPQLAGRQQLTVPRYIPAADMDTVEYLVFAEIIKDQIDPYRGILVDSKDFVEYLAGAVEIQDAKPAEKFGYLFRFLESPDETISADAYKEFDNAPYSDIKEAAAYYDPDTLLQWINADSTASYRIGLYGYLLGLCGRPQDAPVIREIVASKDTRPLVGVDGLMGGYCVLEPKEGIDFVLDAMTNQENEFHFRLAALRTISFIVTEIPDIDREHVFKRATQAINIPDMSDLVIDELRKNSYWRPLPLVRNIYEKPDFDLRVVRRAVIRFMLKCPKPEAKAFIAELRSENPQIVADVEEILRFEELFTNRP